MNFLVFHAILPSQAEFEKDLQLEQCGLGIVIRPNMTISHRVRIYHHVTLAAETWVGSEHNIVVGNDVVIGVGAIIIGQVNCGLHVGDGMCIGMRTVVTRDVKSGQTVIGFPARPIGHVISK